PCTEQVLVDGSEHPWSDFGSVRIAIAGMATTGEDYAGRLGFQLDRTVEVEIPEEAVVVVADGGEVGDHQPARATYLGMVVEIGVFPEHAVVLFVHTHGLRNLHRMTVVIGDHTVEVVDQPETVAAEFEAVGVLSQQVLARVEV